MLTLRLAALLITIVTASATFPDIGAAARAVNSAGLALGGEILMMLGASS